MRQSRLLLSCALMLVSVTGNAQSVFEHGDVLVSTFTQTGMFTASSRLLLYDTSAMFKRELAFSEITTYRESLIRGGVAFVATRQSIQRVRADGTFLSDFGGLNAVYLAPALDGGIVASNGSGQLFRFNADASIRSYRDTVILNDPSASGVELSLDQCTVFYLTATRIARWNSCENSAPVLFGESRPGAFTANALRLLPDGTFLAAYLINIAHLDREGRVIKTYNIPADALALDVDGTSFWAGAGSTLVKADIATGQILSLTNVGAAIDYLGVVGEPRAGLRSTAEIPTLSAFIVGLLAAALSFVALTALRP